MTTVDERREIAEKLRKYAECDECECCDDCEDGCVIDRDDFGDTVLTVLDVCGESYRACYNAIVDLIEPCDREALLALAEEIEKRADFVAQSIEDAEGSFSPAALADYKLFETLAIRIQEAVGA